MAARPRSSPGAGRKRRQDLFDDSSACTLTAQQTEGPYYFDADAIRGDIREDSEGVRLRLAVRVRDAGSCEPLRNAVVDVWHCDAAGVYSRFESWQGETFNADDGIFDERLLLDLSRDGDGYVGAISVDVQAA